MSVLARTTSTFDFLRHEYFNLIAIVMGCLVWKGEEISELSFVQGEEVGYSVVRRGGLFLVH